MYAGFRAAATRRAAIGPALLAAILTALLAQPASLSAQDHPGGFAAISVEPTSIDLGTMERNTSRGGVFTIRNDGAADLQIIDVKTSCGCTAAEPDKKLLKAGESTKVAVTFNSGEFQGAQHKTITIHSNDPATPTIEVELTANVHVPILLNPERPVMAFGNVRRGGSSVQKVLLTAVDAKELKIQTVHYPEKILTVEIEQPVDGDPAKAAVTARVRPDAPAGQFNDVLRLSTNVPSMSTIDLELVGVIMRDVEVFPPTVNFRYVERGQTLRQEVRVRPGGNGVKFKVTRATIDLPQFQAKIQESIPGKETIIVITGQPLPATDPRVVAAQGRMQGTLKISTTSADQPEIEVKVAYLLKL